MPQSLGSKGVRNAWLNVAASSTDAVLVAGSGARKIVVLTMVLNSGDTTSSTVQLNSKGAGVGVAISPAWKTSANGGMVLPESEFGYCETNPGESLTVTTGVGSTTGISISYMFWS